MSRVKRLDLVEGAPLKPAKRTDAGFVRAEGFISRVGVQVYRDAKGTETRELRLPEEVFASDSLESFRQVPVTNGHPPELLQAETARRFTVGAVGDKVEPSGDMVQASMVLYDADAIAAAEAGRQQLSCGYSCDLDFTAGEWKGEKYDAIQRNIRGNHVALVDQGRAGPQIRMRLDDATAAMIALCPEEQNTPEETMTITQEQLDAANAKALATQSKVEELQAKLDAELAHRDAMKECPECGGSGKVDGAKCDGCGGKGEMKMKDALDSMGAVIARKVAKGVKARVALELQAKSVLGDDEKLDAMDDQQVKKAVILKIDPKAKLDEKGADYINTRFDVEMDRRALQPSAADAALPVIAPVTQPKVDGSTSEPRADESPDEARRRMVERNRNAWKTTRGGK